MSKKYVIEIKPEYEDSFKGLILLGAKDSNILMDVLAVDAIEELNSDYINEHYGSLQDDAYQRGFEDGKWKAEDGCTGCMWEGNPYDACEQCCNAYKNLWTAKDDKIVVGDEVTDLQSGANFVVTHLWKNNHGEMGVSGFNNDCSAFSATFNKVKKTGRHFDIASILKEMQS